MTPAAAIRLEYATETGPRPGAVRAALLWAGIVVYVVNDVAFTVFSAGPVSAAFLLFTLLGQRVPPSALTAETTPGPLRPIQ